MDYIYVDWFMTVIKIELNWISTICDKGEKWKSHPFHISIHIKGQSLHHSAISAILPFLHFYEYCIINLID